MKQLMHQGSTLFLKATVCAIGLLVLATCLIVLPIGIRAEDANGYRPILMGLYLPAIPFFIALYQALKLLSYIDTNKAFSELSVKTLMHIKQCAAAIALLFAAGMPYTFMVADRDDAPGVILIGLVIIAASIVIGVFAALLEQLLASAMAIKTENDLTV